MIFERLWVISDYLSNSMKLQMAGVANVKLRRYVF